MGSLERLSPSLTNPPKRQLACQRVDPPPPLLLPLLRPAGMPGPARASQSVNTLPITITRILVRVGTMELRVPWGQPFTHKSQRRGQPFLAIAKVNRGFQVGTQ
jgi:hypothetical protein